MLKPIASILLLLLACSQAGAVPAPPRFVNFTGRIVPEGKGDCESGRTELFVSDPKSGTLIYQVDVVPKGTFEFKLKPGKYLFRAVSITGCEGVYALEASGGKPMSGDLLIRKKGEGKGSL